MIMAWVFAALWNAVSLPIAFVLPGELNKGNYLGLVAVIFPLIGIFLIVRAIKYTREYRRFGITALTMDPFPGAVDGDIGGRIHINNRNLAGTSCDVVLACVYSYESGSGDDRSRSERVKWSESGTVTPVYGGNGVDVDFSFQPDATLPESQKEKGDYHFWRLSLRADLPGADLNRHFVIPAFRTGEKSKYTHRSLSEAAQQQREQQAEADIRAINSGDVEDMPLGKRLQITRDGLDVSYYFGIGQELGISLFFIFFAAIFGAAVYGVNSFVMDSDYHVVRLIAFIFSLPFLVVALLATLGALYLPLRSLRITFSPRGITVVRRWLLFTVKRRHVSYDDVLAVDFDRAGSFSSGDGKKTEYFKIFLLLRQGPSVTIGESINGKELAQHMVEHFAKMIMDRQRDVMVRRAFQQGQAQLRDGNVDDLVKTLLQQGKKLTAIKLVRARTGRSLKAAKTYVDQL